MGFAKKTIEALGWLFLAALALPAHGAGRQRLSGHRSPAMQAATLLGDVDDHAQFQLAVGLPFRDPAQLKALIAEISDPHSPQYRHFLKPQEFADAYGPSLSDYQALSAYLRSKGLRVVKERASRAVLSVVGDAVSVRNAFNVRLRRYQRPGGGSFIGSDDEPSLDLDVPVAYVAGLDDFSPMKPHGQVQPLNQISAGADRGGSGPGGLLLGQDFRNAYAPGVTLDGSGQTVALVEFANYFPGDVAKYQALAGLSTSLERVYVDGDSASTPTDPNSFEPSMDIDMVMSMAPHCNVLVYSAPDSAGTIDDVLAQIADDDRASVVSSSWYRNGGGPDPIELQIEQQFAAQGQSYFKASGDDGPTNGDPGGDVDDPLQTLVGGTDLSMTGAGGAWGSEKVWDDATGASQGGILTAEPIPDYQGGIDMSANGGSTVARNFPDVSAVACNIFMYYNDGTGCSTGGTSASCPLWAGFMALIDQRCAAVGKQPIGFANPTLYAVAKEASYSFTFHPITAGSNGGFAAGPGYNLATGWGTAAGQPLIDAIVDSAQALKTTPPSATPTPVPVLPLCIQAAVPCPNPDPAFIQIQLEGACDSVDLKIYSASYRLVSHQCYGAFGPGWNRLDLGPECRSLLSGSYYCSVVAHRGKLSSAPVDNRMMILR